MATDNSLTDWIPVIGTLSGALIGLIASSLIAYFNKFSQENSLKNERNRHRLERIYELLISIKIEKGKDLGKAISWIHYNEPISHNKIDGIPPLVELEMLVKLYFREFEPSRTTLMKSIQNFSKEFIDCSFGSHKEKPLEAKQKDSEKFINLNEKIEKDIYAFQEQISKTIKA
jgi:hypothetical protein